MNSKYIKLGFGKVYPNTKANDKSPDIGGPITMGTADAEGNISQANIWNEARVSMWKQEDGSYTLQITKDTDAKPAVAAAPVPSNEVDDEIPF
tara:strand:+ start:318 stop:596 length:279 start_codon:yes stop_codon:yes gene_type:complete